MWNHNIEGVFRKYNEITENNKAVDIFMMHFERLPPMI